MAIRVSDVAAPVGEPESALAERVAPLLGLSPAELTNWRILRKSLDLRDKSALRFVYAVEVNLAADEARVVGRAPTRGQAKVELYAEPPFTLPEPGTEPLPERPVVVGAGPAGMIAAYFLAGRGYRPLVLERGRAVSERVRDVKAFDAGGPLDPESNYLYGEGGAGTFSDGKLTCRGSGPDVRRVLELLAECKGKPSVVYEHRPHLGSNRLPAVVKALRRRILASGGEIRFSCRVEDYDIRDGRLRGLATSSGYLPTAVALVATGHSARDTYAALARASVPMVPKPFQMGVRIEQPQENVNRAQYGPEPWERTLGAADYSLIAHGGRDLFTFCMCAGGQVIPSVSAPGCFSTNGMSLSKRASRFANSGLMVTLRPEDFGGSDVFAGVRLQEEHERRAFEIGRGEYSCPIQRAKDFLAGRLGSSLPPSSYPRGLVLAEIVKLVPPVIAEELRRSLPAMDRRWRGRFLAEATLVGPEARGSAPVRVVRDAKTLEASGGAGLYPIGEGAGYAGGIVSAGVDGLRAAKAVMARYRAE